MELKEKVCVPCQGGIPPLDCAGAEQLLDQTPAWSVSENCDRISRSFKFNDFVATLEFVNKVAEISEEEGHHPDISFGWGYAEIMIYTHKINGLHENDFILAAKIDLLM